MISPAEDKARRSVKPNPATASLALAQAIASMTAKIDLTVKVKE